MNVIRPCQQLEIGEFDDDPKSFKLQLSGDKALENMIVAKNAAEELASKEAPMKEILADAINFLEEKIRASKRQKLEDGSVAHIIHSEEEDLPLPITPSSHPDDEEMKHEEEKEAHPVASSEMELPLPVTPRTPPPSPVSSSSSSSGMPDNRDPVEVQISTFSSSDQSEEQNDLFSSELPINAEYLEGVDLPHVDAVFEEEMKKHAVFEEEMKKQKKMQEELEQGELSLYPVEEIFDEELARVVDKLFADYFNW
jgi:hypothetical protein